VLPGICLILSVISTFSISHSLSHTPGLAAESEKNTGTVTPHSILLVTNINFIQNYEKGRDKM